MTRPSCTFQRTKPSIRKPERLRQEIPKLTHSVVDSGRQLEEKTPWTPAPHRCSIRKRVTRPALGGGGIGHELAGLKDEKLPAKKREAKHKDLLKAIAETRKTGPLQSSTVTPVPFQIHDGEMRAAANTPGKSVYELTAQTNAPVLTALRIEVLPVTGEAARHTPEGGFIVDQIEAWVILPDGRQDKIAFRSFRSGF